METDIILYPSEEVKAAKIVNEVSRQFAGRANTAENISEMGKVLIGRFLSEVGLVASFEPDHVGLGPDGLTMVTSPHLIIEGRLNGEAMHDHDRHRYEATHGQNLTGQVGEVQVDGTIKGTKKTI